MNGPSRQDELLIVRALEGVTPEDAAALIRLRAADDDSFDRAAAALALATIPAEPLPAGLADAILADAPRGAAPRAGSGSPRRARGAWVGWAAAAACLLVAGAAWLRPPEVKVTERLVVQAPPPEPPPAARRDALLREAADARTVAWAATADPAARGASGDVVWSGARQAGFMRIRGLRPNDRAREQYQLWVFDASRDERHPVDGGVFDVVGDEVVVPIHAAVAVDRPTLFAVTVERPGGVVVSKRERIVLAAAVVN
jgi:hypothetical protein